MKRGTMLERALALIGIGLWVVLALVQVLTSPGDVLFTILIPLLAVLAVVELRRWQAGKDNIPYLSGKPRTKAYPATAWFAVGAVPAVFIVGVVTALVGEQPADGQGQVFDLTGIAAWVIGGWVTSALLVRNAKRREERAAAAMPPPPPPSEASSEPWGDDPARSAG